MVKNESKELGMQLILDVFWALLSNYVLVVVVAAWFLAQVIKIFYYWVKDKKFNLWHFLEAGGMPSAH